MKPSQAEVIARALFNPNDHQQSTVSDAVRYTRAIAIIERHLIAEQSRQPIPSTLVLHVAARDPFFRKWMKEQLDAMGEEQIRGEFVTVVPDEARVNED